MNSNGTFRFLVKRHPRIIQLCAAALVFGLCFIGVGLNSPVPGVIALLLVVSGIAFWDIEYTSSRMTLIALIASVISITLGAALGSIFKIDSTTYPWWNFIASFMLAVATFATLLWTVSVTQQERQRRIAEEERAQAARITAWTYRGPGTGELYLHNGSNMPVFQVIVIFEDNFSDEYPPPDGIEQSPYTLAVLPPGKDKSAKIEGNPVCDSGIPIDQPPKIVFKDAAGRFWMRDDEGELYRMHQYDAMDYWEMYADFTN